MRQLRPSLWLALGAAALSAACSDDTGVTNSSRPALAGVRYINALPDTFDVDIRMVDQLQWSATANKLQFRSATEYFPVEAGKPRHIRVFPQPGPDATSGADPDVVSQVLLDTEITFEADKRYTLLLMGSSRSDTEQFMVIEDAPPTTGATQIAVKAVNAGVAGGVDAYLLATATTAISGTPAIAGVAPLTESQYVMRDSGSVAVRFTDAGTTTVLASAAAPNGATGTTLQNPLAGVRVAGTALSAYIFPRAVAGSKAGNPLNPAFAAPAVIWFVDRLPPNTAVSSQ